MSNSSPLSIPTVPSVQPKRKLTTSFPTLKPLEPNRRPSTRTSSSFRGGDSSNFRAQANEEKKSRGSSRFRGTSNFRRRKPVTTTTTTKRPKSFNQYEDYYYDY